MANSYIGAAMEQAAYRAWAAGHVIPDRITTALDANALYGPEVDRACGVEEPAVDEWEAGVRYPSWEQLQALAALCGVTTSIFTIDPQVTFTGPVIICDRSKRKNGCQFVERRNPVMEFTAEAIAAANLPKPPPPPTNPTPRPPTGRRRIRGAA